MTTRLEGRRAVVLFGAWALLSPALVIGRRVLSLPEEWGFDSFLIVAAIHVFVLLPLFGLLTSRMALTRPLRPSMLFVPAAAFTLSFTLDLAAWRTPSEWTDPTAIRLHFAWHEPSIEQSPYRVFNNPVPGDGAGYFVHTDEVDAHGNGRFWIGNRIVTAPTGLAVIEPTEIWHTRAVTNSLGGGWWYATAR